ncbi:MAG: hypothetical protein AAB089_04180, partial [Nitrospirota bacterium]
SGEEYLDIMSDYPIKLQGIENKELYDEHIKAFLEVEKFQSQAKAYIANLSGIVEELRPHVYSSDLLELSQLKNDIDAEKITLADFCVALAGKAKIKEVSLSEYLDFNNFVELANLEGKIDLGKAEEERQYLLSQLTSVLTENELKSVNDEALKKAGEKQFGYYSRLNELAMEKLPDFTKSIWSARTYANLNIYLDYLKASEGIDLTGLSSQIEILTTKIKESLFSSDDQRKLSEISDNLQLLDKLVELKFSPEEYEAYQNKRKTFDFNAWVEFLKTNAAKFSFTKTVDANFSVVADNLDILDQFYQIGEKRNEVFIQNIILQMEDDGTDIACLITGGFHTPFIIEQLREKGVSYCVIAPRITQAANDAQYVKILKEKAGIK